MEKKIRIFIFLLFLALILRLFGFYYTKTAYKDGDYLSFTTTIYSSPKVYGSYQTFSLETPSGEQVLVKTKPDISYQYGNSVAISGNLNIKLLKGRSFLSIDYPEIKLSSNTSLPLAVLSFVRQKISETFENTLSQDDSALLLGIVFGIKQNMSQTFYNSLKTAGVMHVIAASGMNVTMTAGFIFYMFSLFLKRQIAIIFTVLGIVFYAGLAGFQASIIRASIMGIIAFMAQGLGKQAYGLYALLLTGLIMLFFWPNFLTDIGFQLSFLSTIGILFIPKMFSRWKSLVSTDFLTTISAQIATLPILLINFGTYSIWSIIVNTLLLWTVPILMVLGGIAAIFSFFATPISQLFLYISIPLLSYFEEVVRFFTNLGGVVSVNNIPTAFAISYYFFLAGLIIFLNKKPREISK